MSGRAPLPASLYAATARDAVPTPPLDGDRRASVAIIGGGFTGLSAALHLAEGGADTVLIEANEPGWGASGRNGGQVNPGLKHEPDRIERDFGSDLGARVVAFSGAAPALVFDLVRRHQIRCDARQGGTLRAAYAARQVPALADSAAQAARRGLPVALLDAAATEAMVGTGRYRAALLDRRGGTLDPLGFARGLAEAAIHAGATLHGATRAQAIARDGGVWHVRTPTGTIRADRVVIATNGYTDDLWPQLRRSILPLRSGIVASDPLPAPLARRILADGTALYEIGPVTTYVRTDRTGRLLIGGRSRQRDGGGLAELGWLTRYAERLWPELRGVPWRHGWTGRIAATADHYPHLHAPAPGLLIALGYNGRGVAMATATGAEIARHLLGAPAASLDLPVTAIRPIRFHAAWPLAATLRILTNRLRERLFA